MVPWYLSEKELGNAIEWFKKNARKIVKQFNSTCYSAQDLMQEVMSKVIDKKILQEHLTFDQEVKKYIYQMMLNLLIDEYRKHSKNTFTDSDPDDFDGSGGTLNPPETGCLTKIWLHLITQIINTTLEKTLETSQYTPEKCDFLRLAVTMMMPLNYTELAKITGFYEQIDNGNQVNVAVHVSRFTTMINGEFKKQGLNISLTPKQMSDAIEIAIKDEEQCAIALLVKGTYSLCKAEFPIGIQRFLDIYWKETNKEPTRKSIAEMARKADCQSEEAETQLKVFTDKLFKQLASQMTGFDLSPQTIHLIKSMLTGAQL